MKIWWIYGHFFRITPKTKIDLVNPPYPQSTNYIHFPINKDTVEENLNIFTVLKGDDKHKFKNFL